MAVQIIDSKKGFLNSTGIVVPGQVTFLMDSDADIDSLPVKNMTVGSQAMSIEQGTTWIFAPSLKWKKFGGSTSTSW